MSISHSWQPKTALLLALGMTSTAILGISASARAVSEPYTIGQVFSQSEERYDQIENSLVVIPAGAVIPVQYEEAERIIVTPEETVPATLTVAANIRSSSRELLIPAGSKIEGELQPAEDGTQFVAQELILDDRDRSIPVDATSEVITETRTITKETNPDILKGAAIGSVAATVIAEIFGEIDFLEVLGGAGLGAITEVLLQGSEEAEVTVIDPNTELDLTLQSDLSL